MEWFLKHFFGRISPIFEKKKRDKSKFLWLAHSFKHFSKLKFSPILVSKKRNEKESMICLTPKPSQTFLGYRIQSKIKFLQKEKKNFLREKGEWSVDKKNEGFLTVLVREIKKSPSALIRKHANELKVQEKTAGVIIK